MTPKSTTPDPLPSHGIRVESHRHARSGAAPLHAHDYPSLLYVTSGHGGVRLGEKDYALGPDSAVWIGPKIWHETYDQTGHPLSVFSIAFRMDLPSISKASLHQFASSEGPIVLPVFAAKQIQSMLRALLHEQMQRPPEFERAMESLLSRLLILIYRNLHRQNQENAHDSLSRVREVIQELRENFHEQHSLSDVARMAHLSQRQFSNLCHQITGTNFVHFLNGLRSQKALELLQNSTMPVSAIAFEVGYEELSTFYRAFKKEHGAAPRAFRTTIDNSGP